MSTRGKVTNKLREACQGRLRLDRDRILDEVVVADGCGVVECSAATINRYLAPMWTCFELKGKSATEPGLLFRNSISIRRAGDELADMPEMLECDSPRSLRSNIGG